jgi:hypothetical protein
LCLPVETLVYLAQQMVGERETGIVAETCSEDEHPARAVPGRRWRFTPGRRPGFALLRLLCQNLGTGEGCPERNSD